jgi:phospholipid/cholesterol/gamma-HCH transport system substrate-binding protein
MPHSAPSAARIVVIAGFALSCFGLLLFLWLAFGGSIPLGPKGYRFQVAFPDAATLADQSDVRVAGVNVGKVVLRERAPEGDRTMATIEIQERYAPVRRDAKAMLRQKTLLGETYVELDLGSKDAPGLPENGRLPNGAVKEAVEFDELLTTFDAPTRKALQEWQRATAQATNGRAADLNDALGSLPVFAESGQTLVDVLNRRRDALQGVVRDTGTTFDALNRDAGSLQTMIRRSDEVLSTLAARRAALAESVQIFPTFLDESRRTLNRVDRFGKNTNPLLRDLEPVLEDAQPTLRSLAQFAPDAERLFEDLPALIRAGRTGLPALSRVLRGLDPTLESLGPFLQQLNPVLEFLELYQSTFTNFISIGASATAIKLGSPAGQNQTNGHALPQMIVMGSQSLPAKERTADNRGNAYFAPDALLFGGKGKDFKTPPSWDCAHVGGEKRPAGSGNPGCWVQGGIPFEGRTQRYPQVREGARGGLTTRPNTAR